MSKILILVLLVTVSVQIQVSSTFTGPYPFDITFTQSPIHSLGQLKAGDIITVQLVAPFPLTDLQNLELYILDNNYQLVSLENPIPATIPPSFPSMTGSSDSTSVQLPSHFVTGQYHLMLALGGTFYNADVYQLSIKVNGLTRSLTADLIRIDLGRFFFFKQLTTLTIQFEGLINTKTAYANTLQLLVYYSNNTGVKFQMIAYPIYPLQFTIAADGTATATIPNLIGYGFFMPYIVEQTSLKITYNTDVYQCPYLARFFDKFNTFDGCFQPANAHQNLVIKAHQCGTNQYFNVQLSICVSVSSACNTFDPLSGYCLTCWANSAPSVLGMCPGSPLSAPKTCPFGTRLFENTTCISENCLSIFTNGSCSECINKAYALGSNGNCNAVPCSTGQFFNISLGVCTPLPNDCTAFSPLTQKCTSCVLGYSLDSKGVCINPCPLGYAPAGETCLPLPSHCVGLTFIGHCRGCESGFRLQGGGCQPCDGPNPNFPCVFCPINQIVGSSGLCIDVMPHCFSLSQETGKCISCASGVPPVNGVCCASSSQTVSNGVCVAQSSLTVQPSTGNFVRGDYGHPHYAKCLEADSAGFCTKCQNGYEFTSGDFCS